MKAQFKAMLLGFENYLNARNQSKTNIKSSLKMVEEYFEFISEADKNKSVENIYDRFPVLETAAFFEHLTTRENKLYGGGLAPSTINIYNVVLRSLNVYLMQSEKGCLQHTQIFLPTEKKVKTLLSKDEVNELIEAIPNDIYGERDRVIILLLYCCGLRINELVNINIGDLQLEQQLLFVRKGKWNKERFVPLPLRAVEALKSYLRVIRPKMLKDASEALFLSRKFKRITVSQARTRIQELKHLSDNEELKQKNYGTHTFRHSIAHELYKSGLSIQELQRFLGHGDIATTQIYLSNLNQQDENI